jgi:cation transport regulator ChaC
VVQNAGDSVWGALYDVDEGDMNRLDRKEGAGWAYRPTPVDVSLIDGSTHRAVTYTVVDKEPIDVPPAADYLGRMIEAAHERELPLSYRNELERLPARLITSSPPAS